MSTGPPIDLLVCAPACIRTYLRTYLFTYGKQPTHNQINANTHAQQSQHIATHTRHNTAAPKHNESQARATSHAPRSHTTTTPDVVVLAEGVANATHYIIHRKQRKVSDIVVNNCRNMRGVGEYPFVTKNRFFIMEFVHTGIGAVPELVDARRPHRLIALTGRTIFDGQFSSRIYISTS